MTLQAHITPPLEAVTSNTTLKTDPAQIAQFVDVLFRYATEGTYISLRAFDDREKGKPPFAIDGVKLNGAGLGDVIKRAQIQADRAARATQSIVFAPPVATFNNPKQAREQDLADGLALSVECDATPKAARDKLASLLGVATLVAASGGEWTDPETGEVQDKLHLHWRLNEPTQNPEEHAKLKLARRLAAELVGSDTSNVPMVHPIRWPGSIHRKGKARLAKIVELNEGAEIDLDDTLDLLQEAVAAMIPPQGLAASATPTGTPPRNYNGAQIATSTGGYGKTVEDYADLMRGARTDGDKHIATVRIAASLAGQGVNEKFATALIQHLCPVWDQNLVKSIASGFAKYRNNTFRHVGVDLVRDDKDRPVWNMANAITLLSTHADWKGVLAFNKFTVRREILKPMPGQGGSDYPRALDDDDYTAVQQWFNRNGFPRASSEIVGAAVRKACRSHSYDPLIDYLDGLKWDGKPRAKTWLTSYTGAEASDYVQEAGKRWLISAVARAYIPGCKADHMLVLEGTQGRRKSSALAALAGDEWFSDALPPMNTKDASSYLRGRWIVEVGELEAMRREVDAVKAFLSRQVEHFRPAYGREEVTEKRRCVFAGTTNKDDWQRDETGGRRFWPVKVGVIDVEAIERDRDQIWAEAVAMFKGKEIWWLEGDVEQEALAQAADRQSDDPWRSEIEGAVEGLQEVAAKMVLSCIGFLPQGMDQKHTKRVNQELVRMGWKREGQFTTGQYKGSAKYVRG